jgi:hypothetical protein
MNMLSKLATVEGVEQEKDRIGGGGFIWPNGLYLCTVEHAYISVAESEAMALNVKFTNEEGKSLRGQFWMTSGKEKGCKNYYEKDGKRYNLPGYNQANHLAILTTEQEISKLETEDKTLKVYNSEVGAEALTSVPCVTDMFGQKVWVGVQHQIVDKTTKASGYLPTGETKEVNEIDKFFHAESKQTVTEALAGEEAVFFETWKKEFEGKPAINRAKGVGQAGAPAKGAAPGAAAGAKKATGTLFGKK